MSGVLAALRLFFPLETLRGAVDVGATLLQVFALILLSAVVMFLGPSFAPGLRRAGQTLRGAGQAMLGPAVLLGWAMYLGSALYLGSVIVGWELRRRAMPKGWIDIEGELRWLRFLNSLGIGFIYQFTRAIPVLTTVAVIAVIAGFVFLVWVTRRWKRMAAKPMRGIGALFLLVLLAAIVRA